MLIEIKDLKKVYQSGDEVSVEALKGVSLQIEAGEFVAIMGHSGSGKSTLMNILGCLDIPTAGSYHLDGVDIGKQKKDQLAEIRNGKLGFVFQGFNLLSRTSALENVEMPLYYSTVATKKRKARALEMLGLVNLQDRVHHLPSQLSGGQQQRVAIARALVNDPPVILADEPTGNLDTQTSIEIMQLFDNLNKMGKTIILVTHEHDIAEWAHRTITVKDGMILSDTRKVVNS